MIRKFTIDESILEDDNNPAVITVGVSNHHIHLCKADMEQLFGEGFELHPKKPLTQPGQFAAEETLTVIGSKGMIENVRILGPLRAETQVELSETEARQAGINALLRDSGDLEGTFGCILLGPNGYIQIDHGVICAATHLHLHTKDAEPLGIKDHQRVDIYIRTGNKSGCLFSVPARVGENHAKDLHIDTDEANAFKISHETRAMVLLNENKEEN
jgi:putative phosphotransacetylase